MVTIKKAYQVQDKVLKSWGERPEFAGVGLTSNEQGYAIQVLLTRPLPSNCSIPPNIDNVTIKVDIVGEVYAY